MPRKLEKPIKDAQSLLLYHLWIKHGGPKKVAALCGYGSRGPDNWRVRGRVPLEKVQHVAAVLKESMWALSFAEVAKVYPKAERPKWKQVVQDCLLGKRITEQVLFLQPPQIKE